MYGSNRRIKKKLRNVIRITQGKRAKSEEYIDYKMSEKFGLNWKYENFDRIYCFLEILKIELKNPK